MPILRTEKLGKSFKALQVLQDVSLEIQESERHVIIGPNGAGKTTLFNCITGFLPITSGRIYLKQRDITSLEANERVKLGMARTFQKNNLFWNLSLEQNILLALTAGKSYRNKMIKLLSSYTELQEQKEELLTHWDLWNQRHRAVNELSYGEQRVLEVALALASNPKILLLDEPTSGMSPAESKHATQLIQNLPRSMTMVVIEHDMDVVFSIADRISVMHHGELILTGKPDEIRNNSMVQEIYFRGGTLKSAAD
ncbi:ABC transporter ATP-binding protein [Ferviditalea candida]|uniref:ABC transporter ATP-binding protein n=1 Tax=Ferviditalea candida TaxID=3108399 RepID=A0ABU5ZE77_9BACL|nr:ABC transporter ATP-binding protein [Paenibacillaceae bacterium T2]